MPRVGYGLDLGVLLQSGGGGADTLGLAEADAMKLNPPEAPLYGECLLTVQLSEEECAEGEEDVEFYLLFSGTTQRHLTTTLRVSHVTLQAVCPAHNRGETVQVKLCQARPGGAIDLVAEEHFQFVQDLALDMAHFLVRAAAHKGGLRGAMLLDECQIPLQECERLDETLTLALKHLPLPKGWSVLGTDITTQLNTERGPHDTLLHFAARQGLRRVALFLLQQPGGRDALRFTNKQGHTPAQLAQKRGHSRLQHLLTDFENSSCSEEKPSRRCFPGGRALIHHPVLNTYTLTVDSDPGAPPPDLRADVEELQRLIGSHCREKACCVGPAPLHTLGLEPKEEKCSHSTHSSDGWPCPSGAVETVQSEEGAAEGGGDQAAEGVCVGTPQECVALGTISCTEQRLEEADKVLGVVGGEQESSHLRPSQKRPLANHSGAQSQTRSTAQSDCGGEGAMGQSHGVLPTETPQRREGEVGWRMGDLPGREGEEPSSLSAPHIGSSEDGTWVENSERSDMPADSDQGNAQAGREIVQPSESREDPGSHSAQTEAPGSAQLDPEMEESDAASLQTTMVPGPDFDAHRGTTSEGGASHDHPQNSSRTEPAPLSVEHASTTGKTALCDEIAKGEVDGFLNEEHRQNLDASKPALVISVPTGEETRNDATPIGQTPSDRDRKSPDDGEVSSPETEPVTGSESQPMTCSTSPPVAGETPSAPSESELPQESRVMNPVEQKPDEPPRPPTALDPTQDHTPSGGHGSQTQEAAAAGPPGSEAPSPHQPLEIEETREECEKLPAASAEGCEGTEPSAPPPPPCGLDCQDDSSETSLDPQTEITTSSVTSGAAPVQIETAVSSDSSMTLDRTSTSDPLNFSEVLDPTSPLDIESGTAMYLAISSPVEVDGGLAQEMNCGGPETQSREEPHQEQLTDQPSDSVSAVGGDPQGSLKHTDPSEVQDRGGFESAGRNAPTPSSGRLGLPHGWQVRRGPEVFCPVGEVCSPVLTEQPGTDLSPEEMCLCVSVNSLPALDSVSDGDSLLGPETDDSVFKQIEDTITLAGDSTSGISLTGSISTDDSSAGDTSPVGGAEEGEKQDCLMEVPERSVIVRTSARALSPTRRHSWEANRNSARESDMDQRSVVQNLEEMKSAGHRRSMSWCPSDVHRPETDEMNARSYSLEGLSDEREGEGSSMLGSASPREPSCPSRLANEERGSLVSLTEEDQEEDLGDASSVDSQRSAQGGWCSGPPAPLNLTKSVSMSAISPRDLDDSLMPLSGTLESSISEEEPGPLRSDSEARVGVTKVSRTFSYLKSKMTKKNKEKDREKNKDGKEKEKWSTNGHIFSPASTPPHLFSPASTPPPIPCLQCNKPVNNKDALLCTSTDIHLPFSLTISRFHPASCFLLGTELMEKVSGADVVDGADVADHG
ncbi:A-kinase anchor protein 13 isoform X2 [Electrophorus electricus]|uniref:A-kinase anchor protein 13 isoform X2 n=1 Tax=Electrophorus electricus TaxID=8005 RepID=UPI0015CFA2B3|nr:A-kinase anchor protein 13 isoform X2 [Electrophorus electricus]